MVHLRIFGGVSILAFVATGCSTVEPETTSSAEGAEQALSSCVVPVANLVIDRNTTLCPGSYTLSDPENDGVIQVVGNQVELVITGVTLTGNGTGYGISANGVSGVTIRSSVESRGRISNYLTAIHIRGGASHRIVGNELSSNVKRPLYHSEADFLSVWDEWEGHLARRQIGNGIVLRDVSSATVENNIGRNQQNGLSLFGSTNVTIRGNDFSDNQGWGIHLHRSSNNTIASNRADNVHLAASTYCHEVQSDACDTASILVIKASNDNLVRGNSFRNGGDGIFSAARQGALQHGADRNRYIGNDVSFAKHLGIEATFADGLLVENNLVVNVGRSGIWLGGSKNSVVRNNAITGSGWNGIENEGAQNMTIEGNIISGSAQNGILLRGAAFGPSREYSILRNTLENNGHFGIRAVDTAALTLSGNTIRNNGFGSVQLELDRDPRFNGLVRLNENRLFDGTKPCGGVDVRCGCGVFNGDVAACDATPGCAYYVCSGQCHSFGTSHCDAGCTADCTGSCHDHDNNVEACDAAGCAYYFCSHRCYPRGTPIAEACPCPAYNGDPAACEAAPGCRYYHCSNQCHFTGTPDCEAGCPEACGIGNAACPIADQTNVTSNYWGTSDTTQIEAAICGAELAFVPFKTKP